MRGMNSESVDLIYLDPPFNSKANYAAPIGSEAAGAEFKDTWSLNDVDIAWLDLIEAKHSALWRVIQAAMSDSDKSYMVYMAARLLEMHRLLKPTGSIYLHCDPTMSHYLKLVMDAIWGKAAFRNEVVWWYEKWTNTARHFQRNHDVILFYAKSEESTFNKPYGPLTERQKSLLQAGYNLGSSSGHKIVRIYDRRKVSKAKIDEWEAEGRAIYDVAAPKGKAIPTVWQMPVLNGQAKERVGYPTQKPVALLRRIIDASTDKGDMVLDPFCGCATACVAAQDEDRQWVGIDISSKAAELVLYRLKSELGMFADKSVVHRTDLPERTDLGDVIRYNDVRNKKLLYGEQGGHCNGCSNHFQIQNLTVDHIIPRSKGGTDHIGNLQLLCGHCNSVKGDRGMDYLLSKLAA